MKPKPAINTTQTRTAATGTATTSPSTTSPSAAINTPTSARTGTQTRTPLSKKQWLLIVMLALVGQVAWAIENNFFNLFIQDVFGASLNDVALMVSASAITATATTVFAGAWSDRAGKRKCFIVVGSFLWGCSILLFCVLQNISGALARDAAAAASLGITLTIVFDCVMTFFGSLSNDSAFNAWVTDITDDTNRGRVEGVNSSMPLVSMLLVFGGAMFLMVVASDGSVTYNYSLLFGIIGAIVIVLSVITGILMQDSHPQPRRSSSYLSDVAYGFKPASVRANPMLYLVLASLCIFAIAMQVIMPYYVLYLRLPYILGESYVFVMAPCIVMAALYTVFYARRVDKVGFVRSIILPIVLFVAGCLVLTFLTSAVAVFIGSLLMLSGYLGGVACFAAEVRNHTPADRAGLLQGVRIFTVVLLPMLIGPWIGSIISAQSGAVVGFGVVGDGFTPSSLIFLGGAIVAVLTVFVLYAIRKRVQ